MISKKHAKIYNHILYQRDLMLVKERQRLTTLCQDLLIYTIIAYKFCFGLATGYSGDDVGRTVAIIIGILVGLGLFVVFISFLRKTCG
jgi:hypothetical protein